MHFVLEHFRLYTLGFEHVGRHVGHLIHLHVGHLVQRTDGLSRVGTRDTFMSTKDKDILYIPKHYSSYHEFNNVPIVK